MRCPSQQGCLREPQGSQRVLSQTVTLTYILWHISDVSRHATVSYNSMSHRREPAEILKWASIQYCSTWQRLSAISHNKGIKFAPAKTAGWAMLLQWVILKCMNKKRSMNADIILAIDEWLLQQINGKQSKESLFDSFTGKLKCKG